jgi:phosphosulfolactate synthase (CoM biosynthesis protein A)
VEKLRQLEASKNSVVIGLQHKNKLLQKVTNWGTLLQTETGLNSELRRDKESIEKQLELVTLRLPAPKVGFWARTLWRSKKRRRSIIS